jgi:hypothetical protein
VSGNSLFLFFAFCDCCFFVLGAWVTNPRSVSYPVCLLFLLAICIRHSITHWLAGLQYYKRAQPPSTPPLTHVQGDSRSAVGFLHCGSFASAVLWAGSAVGQVMGGQSVGYPVNESS